MKNLKAIKLISAILAISAQANAGSYQIEPLLGSGFDNRGISIQVYSGGCTQKSSFQVYNNIVDGRHRIAFVRIKTDPCRAFYRYGTKITYSYDELGIQEDEAFFIANPRAAGVRH